MYITGGSTGLGLALAVLLTKKGAHVSVVARDKGRLDKAMEELEVRSYCMSIVHVYAHAT